MSSEPEIVQFGPRRLVGLRYAGKNENAEVKALWDAEDGFIARVGEINPDGKLQEAFGVMRCLPGANDGSFEYIAAAPVSPDVPVPPGMVETHIPEGTYAAFVVPHLDQLTEAWGPATEWMQSNGQWEGYCGPPPGECACANHPFLEFYPPDFSETLRLYLYFPIRPKQ